MRIKDVKTSPDASELHPAAAARMQEGLKLTAARFSANEGICVWNICQGCFCIWVLVNMWMLAVHTIPLLPSQHSWEPIRCVIKFSHEDKQLIGLSCKYYSGMFSKQNSTSGCKK